MSTAPQRSRAAVFAANSNQRALRLGVPGRLTATEVGRVLGPCAYCDGWERVGWDHVLPLGRGGHNIASNVVPCCVPCNQRKGTRTPAEMGVRIDLGWWHPEVGPR